MYWDHRAEQIRLKEEAGKKVGKINSENARRKAIELDERRTIRLKELEQERQLKSRMPVVIGGALVVPQGLIDKLTGEPGDNLGQTTAEGRKAVEDAAMQAVTAIEKKLNCEPRDISKDKCGYDIESRDKATGRFRFIEVKGVAAGNNRMIVTKNEILTSFNKPDAFILAMVHVDGDRCEVRYLREPFAQEPGFAVEGMIFNFNEFWAKGSSPS